MLNLPFETFLLTIVVIMSTILIGDILWFIGRWIWKWIDDAEEIKFESFHKWLGKKFFGLSDDDFIYHNSLECCFCTFFLLSLSSCAFLLAIWVYYATAMITFFTLLAHLTRFVRRLAKRLKKHENDVDAHKK